MHKTHKFKVNASLAGTRADIAIYRLGFASSRSQAQKIFQSKNVFLKDKVLKGSYALEEGDEIRLEVNENLTKPEDELLPYDFPLQIDYEDNDLLIVNKPSGLVVHPSYGHANDTMVNALIARQINLSPGSAPHRPGLVHRIDKDTSGLLVVAKNAKSHTSLAKQFKNKTVTRIYWALVFGKMNKTSGKITSHLVRHPNDRKKFYSSEDEDGKLAITNYKVLAEGPELSLLELQLETGRTHQIRVHLSGLGHPICGDETYGGVKIAKNLKNQKLKNYIKNMDRFALHAKSLTFCHPSQHERIHFDSKIADNLIELFQLSGLEKWTL